jgi:hypothetical protein
MPNPKKQSATLKTAQDGDDTDKRSAKTHSGADMQ